MFRLHAGSPPSATEVHAQVGHIFSQFDADRDGKLDESEFQRAVIVERRLLAGLLVRPAPSSSPEAVVRRAEAPRWVPDERVASCSGCSRDFHWLLCRWHHCRGCGDAFCDSCCSDRLPMPDIGYDAPVRVCRVCMSCRQMWDGIE